MIGFCALLVMRIIRSFIFILLKFAVQVLGVSRRGLILDKDRDPWIYRGLSVI